MIKFLAAAAVALPLLLAAVLPAPERADGPAVASAPPVVIEMEPMRIVVERPTTLAIEGVPVVAPRVAER